MPAHGMHETKAQQAPDLAAGVEVATVLSPAEHSILCGPTDSYETSRKQRQIVGKIARNPMWGDVLLVLQKTAPPPSSDGAAYTPAVHQQLLALMHPLVTRIHDVGDANLARTVTPVRVAGIAIHDLGGVDAMRAVYDALRVLLQNERSFTPSGEPWSEASHALDHAWYGVGAWPAAPPAAAYAR